MTDIAFAVVLAVGVLFAASGVAKWRDGRFRAELDDYRLLPRRAVDIVAAILPILELLVGLVLLAGVLIVPALFLAAALLLVFAAGMTINLARGRRIACGCTGGSTTISWLLVLRNLLLAAAAVGAAVIGGAPGLRAFAGTDALPADDAAAVAVVLVLLGAAARLTLTTRELRRQVRLLPALPLGDRS